MFHHCNHHHRSISSLRTAAGLGIVCGLFCLPLTGDAAVETCQAQTKEQPDALDITRRFDAAADATDTSPRIWRDFPLRSVDSSVSASAIVSVEGGEVRLSNRAGSGFAEVGIRLNATADGVSVCTAYRRLMRREVTGATDSAARHGAISAGPRALSCNGAVKPGSQFLRVEVFTEITIDTSLALGSTTSLRGSLAKVDVSNCTGSWCTHGNAELTRGDFNGDGRQDLLCRDPGRLWLDYADASDRATGTTDWFVDTHYCTHGGATILQGDYNGDDRTDLLCRDPGRLWIDYADGPGHLGGHDWYRDTSWCTHAGATVHQGDFNGDGRTDLLCHDPDRLQIDHGDELGHFAGQDWSRNTHWCTTSGAKVLTGDFDGDGSTDLLCHGPDRIAIDYARNSGFTGANWDRSPWCHNPGMTVSVADVTNDGRADLVCRDGGNVRLLRAQSGGGLWVSD